MIKATDNTKDIVAVSIQPGKPMVIVIIDELTKIAAHISSEGRDILKTLQKRKKWPTTNATMKLTVTSTVAKYIATTPPMNKIITSNSDSLKPGLNSIVYVLRANVLHKRCGCSAA